MLLPLVIIYFLKFVPNNNLIIWVVFFRFIFCKRKKMTIRLLERKLKVH